MLKSNIFRRYINGLQIRLDQTIKKYIFWLLDEMKQAAMPKNTPFKRPKNEIMLAPFWPSIQINSCVQNNITRCCNGLYYVQAVEIRFYTKAEKEHL